MVAISSETRGNWIKRVVQGVRRFEELGIFAATVLFFVVGTVSSRYFLTVNNLTGILQNITFLGFLSVGVGLALMAGEIDISVGSVFGLSAVASAMTIKAGYPVSVAVMLGIVTGLACGIANGLVAQFIKVPVIVVTLATLGIYRAIALALTGGSPIGGLPADHLFFDVFGQGTFGQISFITILFLAVALIVELILRCTSSGFRLFAIGSNPQAARLVGFHVERTRILLLAFSGLIAGVSGVCSVAYLDTASPTAGSGYELSVLAAVIIGGVSLTGGRGSILGVLLGLCVIGTFQNLVVLWGVSPNWVQGVSGLVLIIAMTLTWLAGGRKGSRA